MRFVTERDPDGVWVEAQLTEEGVIVDAHTDEGCIGTFARTYDEFIEGFNVKQVIRIIFTEADVRDMAIDAGVDERAALERARSWGRRIQDTATTLCDEQLWNCIDGDQP